MPPATFPTSPLIDDCNKSDGAMPTINAAQWTNPIYAGQAALRYVSNQVGGIAGGFHDVASADPIAANQEFWFQVTSKSAGVNDSFALFLRLNDLGLGTLNGYKLVFFNNPTGTDTWRFYRIDNEADVALGSNAWLQELNVGDYVGAVMVGDTLSAFVGSSLLTMAPMGSDVVDATYSGSGRVGIESARVNGATQFRLDNLGGGAVGSALGGPSIADYGMLLRGAGL